VIESEVPVAVPVYEPPATVDSTNIVRFRFRVGELIARYGALVVDCSEVDLIGPSGMRVLRRAAREAPVTLVNPNPSLQLMAAAYGFHVDHTKARDLDSREGDSRLDARHRDVDGLRGPVVRLEQ
jgi:anti-anti-sigma regulatory factor